MKDYQNNPPPAYLWNKPEDDLSKIKSKRVKVKRRVRESLSVWSRDLLRWLRGK